MSMFRFLAEGPALCVARNVLGDDAVADFYPVSCVGPSFCERHSNQLSSVLEERPGGNGEATRP